MEHFVDRRLELYQIVGLLRSSRLTVIRGPPGIGKTAVVNQLCHHVLFRPHLFDAGVLFVPLRGVASVDAVVAAVHTEIEFTRGARGGPPPPLVKPTDEPEASPSCNRAAVQQVAAIVGNANVLLVLDGCEDVILEAGPSFR
jgi:predicted ATPase